MRLRGVVLSREGYSRTEFSRASAVTFAPCIPLRPPTARDAAFSPPLHASISGPELRQYHENCAAARMQHGRRPKLTRSIEVDKYFE